MIVQSDDGVTTGSGRSDGKGGAPPPMARRAAVTRWSRHALSFQNASVIYLFVVVLVVFSIWEPSTFLTSGTFKQLLDNQAITGLAAVALVFPLSAGIIDIAIGSEVGLGAILVAWLLSKVGLPPAAAVPLTILGGMLVGVVIALLVMRARISSFIATLGVSSVLAAVIDWISNSQQILNLGSGFQNLATGTILGLTYPVYILLVIGLAATYVLERTQTGRRLYATGYNPEAARLAGVPTFTVVVTATVTCGAIAAVAGLLQSSQLATGDPSIGPSYLLPAFAAVFLGSTQFRGGRYNVWGTIVSVYVLGLGVQGLLLAGGAVWLPNIFDGLALLVAVGLAQYEKSPQSRTAAIRRTVSTHRRRSSPDPAA